MNDNYLAGNAVNGAAWPARTLAPEREYALTRMLLDAGKRSDPAQAVTTVTRMYAEQTGTDDHGAAADVGIALSKLNGQWPPKREDWSQPVPVAVIDCGGGGGPDTIRAVQNALNLGAVSGTYVADGQVTAVEDVSGSPGVTPDGNRPLPAAVTLVDAALMKSLLARKTRTVRHGKNGEVTEFTPDSATLTAVLSPRSWPGLRPLNGIIGSPVLRPDGTLLQEPGYDRATGFYLAPKIEGCKVPDRLSARDVEWAKDVLLGKLLRDFPWVAPADKANYIAMLVTQIVRHRLHGAPVPFFPVTATAAGSGKTLLATIPGALFGQAKMVWTGDDEELRKTLTTVMRGQEGVVTFDNLPKGTVIRSAVLAKLLTDRTWGDRLLGGNVLGKFTNDRLWTCTGNNLKVGGDMASRTVLVSIDPRRPHPERRSDFAVPDLEGAIERGDWQKTLLIALLVLVAAWAAAGCPEDAGVVPMRQFTAWAKACGGFLAYHGIGDFLGNAAELEDMDEDDSDWGALFARWETVLGSQPVTSARVHESSFDPRWEGYFPEGKGGAALSVKSLGRRLAGEKDNYHSRLVLRGKQDRTRMWWWWLESAQADGQAGRQSS